MLCGSPICDLPEACSAVCDDFPKGRETKLLKDAADRFLTVQQPRGGGCGKGLWHNHGFRIQVRDSVLSPLQQDFPLQDGLPAIQHEFWNRVLSQAKPLSKQAHLQRTPMCFQQWGHEDAREQRRLFKGQTNKVLNGDLEVHRCLPFLCCHQYLAHGTSSWSL